jgi:hypothetical protein
MSCFFIRLMGTNLRSEAPLVFLSVQRMPPRGGIRVMNFAFQFADAKFAGFRGRFQGLKGRFRSLNFALPAKGEMARSSRRLWCKLE